MKKMIIIDDEKMVRDGIKTGVDWNRYEIEIVGTAENGKEALGLIKKRTPDIILTDIYMPEMDGLELINRISDIIPHAKSIIMSGYKDFEYAQTAIRNEAFDYILKPIELDYLIDTIEKAKVKIEEELAVIKNKNILEKQLKESLPVLRERYLDYILTDRLSFEEVQQQYGYIDLKLDDENFVVMVIELEINKTGFQFDRTDLISIKNAVTYIVNRELKGEVLTGDQQRIILVLNYDGSREKGKTLEYLQKIARRIKNHIKNLFNIAVSIGIGDLYQNTHNISHSYNEAVEALEYRMFLGKNSTIYIGDFRFDNKQISLLYPVNLETKIITFLKVGEKEKLKESVKKFLKSLLNKENVLPKEIKDSALLLIYTVLKNVIEWELVVDIDRNLIEDKINNLKTPEELENYLVQFLFNIIDKINEKKKNQNSCYVKETCGFMKDNYHNNIKLQDIASYVHITPQYLSRIFKEEMGKTVINYLTDLRIGKARQLLEETNLKIYEIADEVGYNDARYFSRVFKKYTELSPNDYRNH